MTEELCFNLWYYLRPNQTIYVLAARAYMLEGTDDLKAQTLKALSKSDWKVALSWPVSVSAQAHYGGDVPYSALSELGVEAVYTDLFGQLQGDLPTHLPFPDDKLFFATPLFDFGSGFAPAEIRDGYVRQL